VCGWVYCLGMERIRTLTGTLVATLLYFTSIGVEAKVLSCDATKGNGRGWIPKAFQIDVSNDRKTANVISPVTDVFGAKPFEKSFLGSSLWSRGKGKSKMGDYYNYQLRLDLDSNDTEAKIVMTMQGYRDNELQFRCVAGGSNQLVTDDSTTVQTRDTESNATRVIELQSPKGKLRLDFAKKKVVINADNAVFNAIREDVKNTGILRLAVTNISKSCSDSIWQDEIPLIAVDAEIIGSDITINGLDAVFKVESDLASELSFFVTDTSSSGRWSCRSFPTPRADSQLFLGEVKDTVRGRISEGGWNQYTSLRIAQYSRGGREETTVVGYKARRAGPTSHDVKGFALLNHEFCGFIAEMVPSPGSADIVLTCPSGYSSKIDFEGKGKGLGGYGRGTDANGEAVTLAIEPAGPDIFRQFPTLIAQKFEARSVADGRPKDFNVDDFKRLKDRLAQLESKQESQQQAISQDTLSPSIRITASNADGARGIISGVATDNTGIAEVLIDGQAVAVDSAGQFTTSTFIPSGGIDVQITAYDLKGLSTTETIRLERTKRTQTVSRLAAVNPLVGPKQKPSRDRAALIIGVEQYARAPSADYASGDAQMFADYAREKLGIPDNNIKILTDTEAEEAAILRALKVWLPKAVKPDTTDLYVFYAGHGMPTADGTSAYLVPYDGDIQLLEDTAISRKRFFDEISATKPRSATFFFDNCYSGATRSEQQLLAARPLTIKVEETDVPDNYLVFAAGETDQIAGVEPEVKHGRFSYFVFKGLEGEADANSDGKISAGELHKYVRESVGRFSAGAQTPTMLGDKGRWVLR
jgi:hypothetical protein